MFKCCVCNKSARKEKQANSDLAKSTPNHGQKVADAQLVTVVESSIKPEGNGAIAHSDKLNGDVQRFEKGSPPPEEESTVENVVDDLTTKSPVPLVRRDETDHESSIGSSSSEKQLEKSVNKAEDSAGGGVVSGVEEPSENVEMEGEGGTGARGGKDAARDAGDAGDRGGGTRATENTKNQTIPIVVKTNSEETRDSVTLVGILRSVSDGPDDDDDDSVFESCPNENDNKKTPVSSIPRWLSEEDDGEHDSEGCSGMQEPPATPVARDELALRRHRFFSDLLHVTQTASEHRVRFDPLGPMVHAGCDGSDREDHLDELVTRLENVTRRLEKVRTPSVTETQEIAVQTSTPSPQKRQPINKSESQQLEATSPVNLPNKVAVDVSTSNMSVPGFEDLLAGPVSEYFRLSEKIGGDVAAHSKLVQQAFNTQLEFIRMAASRPMPSNQSEQVSLLASTSAQIQKVQEFRESNRGSQYFNHLSAISESIPALGWVAVAPTPAPYVKEMNDAGQFYTNRVLKDWKEKDKIHVDWCKAWIQTLTDLQQYVRQHHTTGLVWAKTGSVPAGIPPPPPPSMPIGDLAPAAPVNDDRSALFAEINQGEAITKNLKKVTSEMQTHKNPSLRTGPAPFKAPLVGNSVSGKQVPPANAPIDKSPVFTRDGKKWLIEYHKGNRNLLVDNAEMNNVVYMFRCQDSTLVIKGKVNSIVMDSCRKSSVVFDSVVSSVEFVNCQSVQMQVLGKVPTISIDKTDGCQMYLNKESLEVEFITSKSSEMNVMIPKGTEDYSEYPIPEQFKTTISPKGLSTIAVDSLG